MKGIARAQLRIQDEGRYVAPSGTVVDIKATQADAVAHTELLTPDDCAAVQRAVEAQPTGSGTGPVTLAPVTLANEKTQQAAQRMSADGPVCVLSFASARNVGGGFMNGAKAQEEDLHRCAGAYRCLETARGYYEANRATSSLLYTDHLIYAPRVPWVRVDGRTLLEEPFLASIITAPAPNAGEHLRRYPNGHAAIRETLHRRAGYVLATAITRGERRLVLGAWGCGVFRNDPSEVAAVWHDWLVGRGWQQHFEQVHVAVWDRTKSQHVWEAFGAQFKTLGRSSRDVTV
ncbi:MAG: TIGR02452 family protein [Bacteroidota bacterium]